MSEIVTTSTMQQLPITTPNIVRNALILLARNASNEVFQISLWYINRTFPILAPAPYKRVSFSCRLPVGRVVRCQIHLSNDALANLALPNFYCSVQKQFAERKPVCTSHRMTVRRQLNIPSWLILFAFPLLAAFGATSCQKPGVQAVRENA